MAEEYKNILFHKALQTFKMWSLLNIKLDQYSSIPKGQKFICIFQKA